MKIARLLPSRGDFAPRHLRHDLLAGLTVAVVALPLALGFGVTTGAGAAAGIATAIVAGFVAATSFAWGGSSASPRNHLQAFRAPGTTPLPGG